MIFGSSIMEISKKEKNMELGLFNSWMVKLSMDNLKMTLFREEVLINPIKMNWPMENGKIML